MNSFFSDSLPEERDIFGHNLIRQVHRFDGRRGRHLVA